MKLHYRLQNPSVPLSASVRPAPLPVVLLHGLFGTLDNLGAIARDLQQTHPILQLDLRNHGLSPHADSMSYAAMAHDVSLLLDQLEMEKVVVIGHSMGGKAAMALTALVADRIEKLVVIDIAPVDYQVKRHEHIFQALQAVSAAGISQRQEAAQLMRQYLNEEGVIQFLLKSFYADGWRFNLPALIDQYANIIGWQEIPPWHHPTLFICGGLSPYVQQHHRDAITRQFPQSRAHVIAGCGHWVHAEQPEKVLRAIHRFLADDNAH